MFNPLQTNFDLNSKEFSQAPNTNIMLQEWESLMENVRNLSPKKSVDAIRSWNQIIRNGLEVEVWKN